MSLFRIEHIEFLYGLALIPVFIFLFVLHGIWKRRVMKRFVLQPNLWKSIAPDLSSVKPVLKLIIFSIAFAVLIVGAANPQIGSKLTEVKRSGADVIIALDVSNSMMAEDLVPNRLEKAKQSISRLLDRLEGDRIGIIVFAGEAYVQLPITTDYAAAKLFLENISTEIVPTQGTLIGNAIQTAMESFGKDQGKNKAIVIITDGEGHEDNAIEMAQRAAEAGIVIHTIGMGSANGVPIPKYSGKVQTGYKKDKDGNTVITKLNEEALMEVATAGNGMYVRATNAETGLNALLDHIRKLEKKQFESKMFSDYDDKFYYFIAVALILFVLELLVDEKKSKWFERLNLFGEQKQE